MSANTAKLQALVFSNQSVHKKGKSDQIIAAQVMMIKIAIDSIVSIMRDPSGSAQILENHLGVVSTFFREQKFQTIVLPVLQSIAKEDTDIWKIAKQGDTQMPLVPKSFENMKVSTKEVRGAHNVVLAKLERERELALLSVYGVTSQILGEVFIALSKNP